LDGWKEGWSSPGIYGHDSAEIHGVHVLSTAPKDLVDYDFVSLFRWMECIPKCIKVSVWAQVWGWCTKPKSIVWPLSTACYLWCCKSCQAQFNSWLNLLVKVKQNVYESHQTYVLLNIRHSKLIYAFLWHKYKAST
jgi:hypothetical protein